MRMLNFFGHATVLSSAMGEREREKERERSDRIGRFKKAKKKRERVQQIKVKSG
jgi:hypothetical protein